MFAIKRKGRNRNFIVKPFPNDSVSVAYFTGIDFEVFENHSVEAIYESGCYGLNPKPRQAVTFNKQQSVKCISEAEYDRHSEWREKFGGSSTTTDDEIILVGDKTLPDPFKIPQSLVLFLEEAFFLHHSISCLEIRDLDDRPIASAEIWEKLCKLKPTFVECFVAYLYLKSKNWVIKSGMKFGGDFLLYKHGPQHFHASFIAIVSKTGKKTSNEYHTNERVAETTGKNLLYLDVFFPENLQPLDYRQLSHFKVKEVVIHRQEMTKQK